MKNHTKLVYKSVENRYRLWYDIASFFKGETMSVETNENSVKENSTEPKKKKMILTKLYVPSQKPKSVQY